jgi:hypothetical protein
LIPGSRSIIIVDIDQVATSCGFSVPFYDFKGFRSTLNDFFETKEQKYKSGKEEESMDKYALFCFPLLSILILVSASDG